MHRPNYKVGVGVKSFFMILAQCISDFSASYGLPVSLLLAGLVGGFTHCAGMCSPFVLAQVNTQNEQPKKIRSALLLPYHFGRMTTYVMLAFVFSGVLNLALFFDGTRALVSAPLLMLAGVLFLVTAFPNLGRLFPWAVRLQVSRPYKLITSHIPKLMSKSGIFPRYVLGILLGFMPCGLVISALLAAASTTNPAYAAFSMALFALGTIPALLMVSTGGGMLLRKYPELSHNISRGAMVVSSLWLFALAGTMLF